MNQKYVGLAIALAACYAGYRFAPNATAKTGAVAVGATIIAKQVPYVREALA